MRRRGLHISNINASSYSPEYQAVLDYATANSITHPSNAEKTRQNAKMEAYVSNGLFAKSDVIMEWKGSADAIRFRKICWKRLIETTEVNPLIWDADGGTGTEYQTTTGGCVDLLWNQSTHAVNFAPLNGTIAYHSNNHVENMVGGRQTFNANQIYIWGHTTDKTYYNSRQFSNTTSVPTSSAAVRTFMHTNKDGMHRNYNDGVKVLESAQATAGTNTNNIHVWALNDNGTIRSGKGQMGCLVISAGLTDAESATMDSILKM